MAFVMVAPDVVTKEVEFTPPGSEETASILVDFKWLSKSERHAQAKKLEGLMRRQSVSYQRHLKEIEAYKVALDAYLDKEAAGEAVELTEPEPPEMPELGADDVEIACDVVKNIQGLKNADGDDLEYSPGLLTELLTMEFVALPFFEALRNYVNGSDLAAALQKN